MIYIGSIIMFREYIDLSIVDGEFAKRVAVIVLVAWAPMQIAKVLRMRYDPTENEKIMKEIKSK